MRSDPCSSKRINSRPKATQFDPASLGSKLVARVNVPRPETHKMLFYL